MSKGQLFYKRSLQLPFVEKPGFLDDFMIHLGNGSLTARNVTRSPVVATAVCKTHCHYTLCVAITKAKQIETFTAPSAQYVIYIFREY